MERSGSAQPVDEGPHGRRWQRGMIATLSLCLVMQFVVRLCVVGDNRRRRRAVVVPYTDLLSLS